MSRQRFGKVLVAALLLTPALLVAAGGAGEASYYLRTPARLIVGFDGELPAATHVGFAGATVVERNEAAGFVVVETALPAVFVGGVDALGDVAYVEVDSSNAMRALGAPNDPRFGEQYALERIDAASAWDVTLGSSDVAVAVVDSGVDTAHPDLARFRAGADFTGSRSLRDACGHGTHVTGIAAATTGNGKGVAGVAQSSVVPVKVIDGRCRGYFSDIASGITWAADAGARVITLSLGCDGCFSQAVADAIHYAVHSKGALVVGAAGNTGPCGSCVNFPAKLDDVMAVACTTRDDDRCRYSSSGPQVEIAAPGHGVLSTVSGGGYGEMSGTSMSVPHVAGVAALVWSVEPHLSAADVRARLRDTARDVGPGGHDRDSGFGVVDAARAVGAAEAPPAPAPDEPSTGPALDEDFDDGRADGWTLSGLWRVGGDCAGAASGSHALEYNRAESCTYDTGARTSGAAEFGVGASDSTALTFTHRFRVEDYPWATYDVMRVKVSSDGGASWSTLASWSSKDATLSQWTRVTLDLSAHASADTRIRFEFDSRDWRYNGYAGWAVDDVRVA